jgi:phage terminase small subunit
MTAPDQTTMTTDAAIMEQEDIEYGPKMRALKTERQRRFVIALFDAPRKEGRIIFAARVAGYGTETSTNKSLGVIGSRLNVSDSIQAAIAEESHRQLRSLSPSAIQALENLLADPSHRDHARGIGMILDRSDQVQTTHNVVVEHKEPAAVVAATKKVLERIEELARRAGLPQLPPPIDAEYSVIQEGAGQ